MGQTGRAWGSSHGRPVVYVALQMDRSYLIVQVVVAVATVAAVGVALWTSQRGRALQRDALRADGRRQAAIEIAQWLQQAEHSILAWHDQDNWLVPEGMQFGPETGIKPGTSFHRAKARWGRP
jgi:hypothetical protein